MNKKCNFLIVFVFQFIIFHASYASEYSQPDFYNVTHYTLENGLRVILKPRHAAKNVSIRLKVNVGHYNFKCGKRETAHYLEHLLFTGTSKHSESQLDYIIESHGGTWNAETKPESTIYKIDIYSKHTNIGLTTLHEIITDSQITKDNITKSLKIIRREAGGKPNVLRNWLYKNGYISSSLIKAMNVLFSEPPWKCAGIDQSTSITHFQINDTYENYYVPQNMTLSIVGDFDLQVIKTHLNKTFGSMDINHKVSKYEMPIPKINNNLDDNVIYEGRFEQLLGTEAKIYQIFRTPNMHHKDKVVFDVLEGYFDSELFKFIRVEKGMAYFPHSNSSSYDKFGFFVLRTDSEIDDIETNIELINKIVEEFKNGDLDEKVLQETKLKILLNKARGIETNVSFANYYVDNDFELKQHGHFISHVDEIEKVTLADIQRVSKKYFTENNRVTAVSSPTLTYTQFYILMLVMLLVISVLVWRIIVRVRRKKSRKNTEYLSL